MKGVDPGDASEPYEINVHSRPQFSSGQKRSSSTLTLMTTALICAVIGGLAGASAVMFLRPQSSKAASPPSDPQTVNLNVDIQTPVSDVVREVGASVVTVIN